MQSDFSQRSENKRNVPGQLNSSESHMQTYGESKLINMMAYPKSRSRSGPKPAFHLNQSFKRYKASIYLSHAKKERLKVDINSEDISISGYAPFPASNAPYSEPVETYFRLKLRLPEDVIRDGIRANFDGSILHITMPRQKSFEAEKFDAHVNVMSS